MHRYRQITYRLKNSIEIIKCIPAAYRKGQERGERIRPKTKEEMKKANMQQAARKLARKINANFSPGDYHLILTYKRAPDKWTAHGNLKNFLKSLRKAYKRARGELKYIAMTEYKGKRVHHHLVINNIQMEGRTVPGTIRSLWKLHGGIQLISLYDSGEYSELASYLIKETEETFREEDSPFKQRYSCSRNLITPEPKVEDKEVKHTWRKTPKPPPGYYIKPDSLYNGFDKMGYRYQRYILIRLNPDGENWDKNWSYEEYWPD